MADSFSEVLAGYMRQPVILGHSGAEVFRLVARGKPTLFLKQSGAAYREERRDEAARLEWLRGKLPVPELVYFHEDAHGAALIMTAVPGSNLTHFNNESAAVKRRLATELARALRRFHALEPRGCPFDHSTAREIERLEAQVSEREASVGESLGLRAARVRLGALRAALPEEDLVLTHGDACLPNVLVLGYALSGFVDLGAAGLGDRCRDLERACWSLGYNYGEGYDEVFSSAYGVTEPDRAKLEFYRELEFFSFDENLP